MIKCMPYALISIKQYRFEKAPMLYMHLVQKRPIENAIYNPQIQVITS
jgi:hypothetical protein